MRLLAALIFFTRLPLWRWVEVPAGYYKRVVECWPFIGWLTGGVMALVLYGASSVFPVYVAVLLAILARIMLTGALHEDGFADFCDGFGGGTSRERILAIMKDSHIGTYGVLGLILYFLLLSQVLAAFTPAVAACLVWTGDVWSKCCSAQLINFLPYARKEEEAKAKVVYERMPIPAIAGVALNGLVALALLYGLTGNFLAAALAPLVVTGLMIRYLRKKIQGYTGDCCGALFLLSEFSFYLTALCMQ